MPSRLLGFGVSLVALSACATQPLLSDWRGYRYGNVEILSELSNDKSLALARDLARFQDVVGFVTTYEKVELDRPLTVFVFRNDAGYRLHTGTPYTVGVAMSDAWGELIGISAGSGPSDTRRTLFHEYVHAVIDTQSTLAYPHWYNEGLAEVLSHTTFERDEVHVGRVDYPGVREHDVDLTTLVAQPLRRDDRLAVHRYYADAWLVVHYLNYGHLVGHPHRGAALDRYVAGVATQTDPVANFSSSFGVSISELEGEVERYLRAGNLPYLEVDADELRHEPPEIEVSEVPPGRAAALLAHFSAWTGRFEQAQKLYVFAHTEGFGAFGSALELAAAARAAGDAAGLAGRQRRRHRTVWVSVPADAGDAAVPDLDPGHFSDPRRDDPRPPGPGPGLCARCRYGAVLGLV